MLTSLGLAQVVTTYDEHLILKNHHYCVFKQLVKLSAS